MEHNELVILFKDGHREWVDPIYSLTETDTHIIVDNCYLYKYEKEKIDKWVVRAYHSDTTYDPI